MYHFRGNSILPMIFTRNVRDSLWISILEKCWLFPAMQRVIENLTLAPNIAKPEGIFSFKENSILFINERNGHSWDQLGRCACKLKRNWPANKLRGYLLFLYGSLQFVYKVESCQCLGICSVSFSIWGALSFQYLFLFVATESISLEWQKWSV